MSQQQAPRDHSANPRHWQVVGAWRHPRDGAAGQLVRCKHNGTYCLAVAGELRAVPQPEARRRHEELGE